jgi:hypothetical protein
VATTPNDPTDGNKPDLGQQMLMREVDEAVRTDEVTGALRKYGWQVGIAAVLGLLGFAGYLYWDGRNEAALERQSEALIQALDELEAGNLPQADRELAAIDGEISPSAKASANMLRAAIALQQGRTDDAVAFYEQVVADENVSQPTRDSALLRQVTANYDNMEPQAVIDRLGPLAVAGNPWFGSAGELVAHAYLDQNKPDMAGPLLVAISQDENVPQSLRARSLLLAGRYGFDAVDDVDEIMNQLSSGNDAQASQ